MGAACVKSEAKAPQESAADKVGSTTEKASEIVHKATSDAHAATEKAQQDVAESVEKAQEDVQAAETETKEKLDSVAEQAGQAPASQADNMIPLSEANQQLLTATKQQVAPQQAAGTGGEASASPRNSPVAYLVFASDLHGGSLIQQWAPSPMTAEQMQAKKYTLLATFVPARHKTVSKTKLQRNGRVTSFLQEIMYKWEMWGKSQRQAYYQGWTKFFKAADEMEATVKLHQFSAPAPPAKVFLLHTGLIENEVLQIREEEDFDISRFGFISAVPSSTVYKAGTNITPKRFGDMATEAGGSYIQLSRRGGDAVFDEAEMVNWLAADGLQVQKGGQGITMDATGTYERRSEKKGGNVSVTQT